MGTSKNDMMMILQLAKTFLAKKFKLKKGGDPFAKLGRAWQEPQCKAIAVFFGVRSALRVKIASALRWTAKTVLKSSPRSPRFSRIRR